MSKLKSISIPNVESLNIAIQPPKRLALQGKIELLQGNEWLALRVSNAAIVARISILLEHLEKLRVNAQATFLEEMRKSMSGTGQHAMLGLARLAHEARLDLFVHVEDKRVIVEAYCPD